MYNFLVFPLILNDIIELFLFVDYHTHSAHFFKVNHLLKERVIDFEF